MRPQVALPLFSKGTVTEAALASTVELREEEGLSGAQLEDQLVV